MDCDKILVLDNGYLKEYDHPHNLLRDPSGYPSTTVKQTSKSNEALLRKMTADTYSGRRVSFQKDNFEDLNRYLSLGLSESESEMDPENPRIKHSNAKID